ncbi:MAG: helix-turn-helix domain-containing protein [Planctomycetota bacterium]|nr:helix-turn-helix domain-containing protein [Planctomycetota bacterium]
MDRQPNDMLTKGEVAAYLRVTPRTVNSWMSQGTIRFHRTRLGEVRFRFRDVQEFMDAALDTIGPAEGLENARTKRDVSLG